MRSFYVLIVSVTVLVLAACTSDSDVEVETGEAPSESSNGGELMVAIPTDAVSMSPHGNNDVPSEQIRDEIYEPLVAQDENLEIVPVLAEEWEEIDSTTWEFKLREDVTFHDGSDFNADVVKANIERLQDPAVASPRSYILEAITEVNIVDDYTVQFLFDEPFAPILNSLSHGAGKMISKDLIDADYENALTESGVDMTVEEYYTLRDEGGSDHEEVVNSISGNVSTLIEQGPIGTNYLQFESRNPGENTILTKFNDYWGETSTIDQVTFKVVTELGSRMAELETGSSDFVVNVQSDNIDRVENNEDLTLSRSDSVSIDYVGFNSSKEPFNNPLVRQAIAHAFDKDSVLSGIYNDSGEPAVSPLAPGVIGSSDDIEGLEYDMDTARALLEEAGYADGFDVTLMVHDDNQERIDLAIFLQESLAELNIDVSVEQIELGTYLEVTANGDHDMFILGWFNATSDPDNGLAPLFHSNNIGSAGNRSFYQNEEVDSLLEEGRRISDENERQEIYEQAQEILVSDAAAIFFRYGESLHAYDNNVEGIDVDIYNHFDFRNVTIQE